MVSANDKVGSCIVMLPLALSLDDAQQLPFITIVLPFSRVQFSGITANCLQILPKVLL